jgi:hypothetical protein
MAHDVVPMGPALYPLIRNPMVAATFADPVAGDPYVLATPPLPETRCPHIADTRRRHGLDAHGRRSYVDVDDHAGKREGRRANGTGGNT